MADTPGISRSSRCTSISSLRWRTVTPSAQVIGRVFFRFVGDDDDRRHAFGRDLAADHARVERTVELLAAGHGDRVVVQDLVGDVDLGRDRRADRQDARVEVGAVAEVGEHVLLVGERRLADPGRAFRAHVREGRGLAVHPQHHVVAADAGQRARAFRHLGRGIVRAARAEVRRAVGFRIGLPESFFSTSSFASRKAMRSCTRCSTGWPAQ
jgi:hypothetical protein